MFDLAVGLHVVAAGKLLAADGALVALGPVDVGVVPAVRHRLVAADAAVQRREGAGQLDEERRVVDVVVPPRSGRPRAGALASGTGSGAAETPGAGPRRGAAGQERRSGRAGLLLLGTEPVQPLVVLQQGSGRAGQVRVVPGRHRQTQHRVTWNAHSTRSGGWHSDEKRGRASNHATHTYREPQSRWGEWGGEANSKQRGLLCWVSAFDSSVKLY